MKILTAILLSVALSQNCFAQDDCSNSLETDKDKFTGEVSIRTPINEPMCINKVIDKNQIYYYLRIEVIGETPSVVKKGVMVLFSDGSKLSKPNEKIDVRVNKYGSGYEYTSFIVLTKKEVDLFAKKKATDVRLYIYDREIDEVDASQFMCAAEAIIKAK